MTTVGILGVSVQSGQAYLADFLAMGLNVVGYARPSDHGRAVVRALRDQGGVHLLRPPTDVEPTARFLPLGTCQVGHDLGLLVEQADFIVVAHPSVYHEESALLLRDAGLIDRKVPLVLAPSRTMAVPYLWKILGADYPVVCFQTCPYSVKEERPGTVYLKRRKRSWIASVEGAVPHATLRDLKRIYPHMIFSYLPATTSLGNIGAVFHPATYVLNWDAIMAAEKEGRPYSFYVEGIVGNPEVARSLEEIDQVRLRIAEALGVAVFGLSERPREEEWAEITRGVRALSRLVLDDIWEERRLRGEVLDPIHAAVVSAQHWLDYTYAVRRVPGESLADAIARTSTYQERSHPQERYVFEDVPTGLVPLESLALRLGISASPLTRVIDLYRARNGLDARRNGRNLAGFETDYLRRYLTGKLAGESVHAPHLPSVHVGQRPSHPGSLPRLPARA